MKFRIPLIVKDPSVTEAKGLDLTEAWTVEEEVFLDGPVTPRVAVLDFDPGTGALMPGIPVEPDADSDGPGAYRIAAPHDLAARDLTNVSVFGSIYRTIAMFEEPDALGRPIDWAFDGPQLLVVPRAGEWANAFYDRRSRSLQFFWFRSARDRERTIYTSHSQDIVAHETAHAILDGIAPDLYHATLPQSLAIHEAVADVAALLVSFRSRTLTRAVLDATGGSIQDSNAFNSIASEFGQELDATRDYLRSLLNLKSLDPEPWQEGVDPASPHDVSQVLSGALYTVMVQLHETLKTEMATEKLEESKVVETEEAIAQLQKQGVEPEQAPRAAGERDPQRLKEARRAVSGKALFVGAERLKRTLVRGLDYLPPGEATFADLGRAILAADQASHPASSAQRDWIAEEFLRRAIVRDPAELKVRTDFRRAAVSRLDLEQLVESDWAAYDFANRNRRLLGIPPKVPFRVLPRLDVRKVNWHREGRRKVRECILKVSWTETEGNVLRGSIARRRRFVAGTTLAIDWESKRIRALLTSERGERQREERDGFLRRLQEADVLVPEDLARGPDGKALRGVVPFAVGDGHLRVYGTGRMLHVAPEATRG
ncbi:MAG TPA: hypothetical protein VM778_10990 [Gemmatimonadota bacterium]|nr:hypothetical protein [Gemmatimonadota bacterium]